MTGRQRTVVTLCVVLAITDGLDAQLLAYAAPHIAKQCGAPAMPISKAVTIKAESVMAPTVQ